MKVTQLFTTNGYTLVKREIAPALQMSGVHTVTATRKVLSDDFLGFGVALTGSSCYLLAQMPCEERTELLQRLYGKDGLNLSVARLSIGASDYSAELYSYDDTPNDTELAHFSIDRDRAYIIPMIREILAIRPDLYLFASPWSPPGWMKTGDSMCGGFMRSKYLDCYAEYITRFVREYAEEGIRISALTVQNEPETHQSGRMPACIWHPEQEAEFALKLRKSLDRSGLDTKIWIHDHNFDGCGRIKWQLDTYPELKSAIDGIAFHYYKGAIEDTRALHAAYPTLKMHFTEGGPRLYDHYDSDFCKWGGMISKVLNESFGSFTGWNLMLDELGGPNIGPFFCGGLLTKNSRSGEISYSGQYKALAHIASFWQNGAQVLETEISNNSIGQFKYPSEEKPLQASLIENPDGSRAYLLINPSTDKKQVQLFEGGTWRYIELLPDSVSTVFIKKG